jgi:predicted anti-sigma-YlaC factor YlaD
MLRPSVTCERVRTSASLRLDDETSQLEERMLQAHLARCEDCATYVEDMATFTSLLRAAPLEPLERPIVVRRLRRTSVARLQLGVAAGVAIAVLGSILQVGLASDERSSIPQPTRFPTLAEGASEMQQALADRRAFGQHRSGSTFVI